MQSLWEMFMEHRSRLDQITGVNLTASNQDYIVRLSSADQVSADEFEIYRSMLEQAQVNIVRCLQGMWATSFAYIALNNGNVVAMQSFSWLQAQAPIPKALGLVVCNTVFFRNFEREATMLSDWTMQQLIWGTPDDVISLAMGRYALYNTNTIVS